jgi:glycosyltransferase involved in cell wall biosynthesis
VVKRVLFAVLGNLAIPTGGYAYDRRIIAGLRALGWRADVLDLGDGFPFPSAGKRASALSCQAAVPTGTGNRDRWTGFGRPPRGGDAAPREPSFERAGASSDLLALEPGLSLDAAATLRLSESQGLTCVRRVIVTSAFTARPIVSNYGVPADRVTIVWPGTDRVAQASDNFKTPLALLAVGAVVPRKGYDVLLAAVARLLDLQWRLTIVGDLGRDADAAARLVADIERFNLADRVTVAGAVPAERLAALYASADVFVLASRFEGYGMAFAEAIAHGVPLVGTTAGAIPENVPASAGVLAPPEDIGAFSAAVRQLIEDSAERHRLAAAARAAAVTLPTWEQSAEAFSRTIEVAV